MQCDNLRRGDMATYETYEIQAGDTLNTIARRFGVGLSDLVALNGIQNPDKIRAGQIINIRRVSETSYVVQRGDSLSVIAGHYGVSVAAIVAANQIANPNFITVGQILIIPQQDTGTATTTPAPL